MKENRWLTLAFCLYAFACLGSMASMSIGAAVMIGGTIFSTGPKNFWNTLRLETRSPHGRWYLLLSGFLIFALILSLLGAKFFPLSYGGRSAEVSLKDMAKAWYFLLPLFTVTGLRMMSERNRSLVLRVWLLTFGVFSLMGIAQYFVGWPRPQIIPGHEAGRFHATLFLGHHLSVASIFIFPFFATLDLIRSKDGAQRVGIPRGILIGAAVAGVVALFFTYSRMLWVTLPLGILLWIVLSLPKKWVYILIPAALILGGGLTQVPAVKDRIMQNMGVGTRVSLWKANLEFFKQRPITGVGWKQNGELSGYYLMEKTGKDSVFSGHAHNNFLDLLGGTGLVGTLSWLAWSALVFALLLALARRSDGLFARGLLCAWVVFHLNGLTQVNFWEGKVLHQLMWSLGWIFLWTGSYEKNLD